jgi:hypothetical protein
VARIPGPANDLYGPFLEVDKHGNSYIAGAIEVNDTPKVFCAKYNTDGVQLWSTLYIYPFEAYIRPTGLAIDSSGNAYVIAEQGPAYYLPTNGLIVKFNNSGGSPEWAKRFIGQYGWGPFRDIKIDRLNNIYVVGWTDSSHLVIRYNTNGDSVWVRKYRPTWGVREITTACTIDDSLNIVFTGQRRFFYPPFGWYDSLLIVKYSSGGILRWESVYAYNLLGSDIGTKITNDQSGNSYIGGVTTISGLSVYLTLKFDRDGSRLWAKIYDAPGGGDNYLSDISMDRINNALYVTGGAVTNGVPMATTIRYNTLTGDSFWVKKNTGNYNGGGGSNVKVDSIGNIYITGATYNYPSYSPYDIMTFKYSSQGDILWLVNYNGTFNGWDNGKQIGFDNYNNVIVLGSSPSSAQIFDYVVIKYNQTTRIEIINNEIPKTFQLMQNYPNPFNPSTKIKFSVPKTGYIQIKIYDVLGRIKEIPINEKLIPYEYELIFDGANYSSGVYFYQLISDGNIIDTKKFVIIK